MRKTRARQRAAFTLIEVLLVLVILVALFALVAVNLGGTQQSAMEKQAKIQVGALEKTLGLYYLDMNQYPSTAQGLNSLVQPPTDLKNPDKWHQYLDKPTVPLDPWDNEYQYMNPGKHNTSKFDLWSLGPDQQDGTADDIGNW